MKTNGEEPFEFLSFGLLAVNAQIDGISNINPRNLRGTYAPLCSAKRFYLFCVKTSNFAIQLLYSYSLMTFFGDDAVMLFALF